MAASKLYNEEQLTKMKDSLDILIKTPAGYTPNEVIAELYERIAKAIKTGYTIEQISENLKKYGELDLTSSTIKRYYQKEKKHLKLDLPVFKIFTD